MLVVDDEQIYFSQVKNLLAADRHEIEWALNSQQAFERMEKSRADLVVLDLKLSERPNDTSGLELLSELRRRWPNVQVIVFTQYYIEAPMIIECMKRGAYYYFLKDRFRSDPESFVALAYEALRYKPRRDLLEDDYPHPLALLYRDYRRNVVVPHLKFRRLIELTELLVKWSAIICLASASKGNKSADAPRVGLVKPSLGRWFEYLRGRLAPGGDETHWVSNMRTIFAPDRRRNVEALITIRNEWLGHGVTRPDHEYTQMVQKWDTAVVDLLHASQVLSQWRFFVAKSARFLGEDKFVHTVVDLHGHNPRFLAAELELPIACHVDQVYVFDPHSKELLRLDPLLKLFVCEQCNQETVFVFDKVDRERVIYLDYANGHHSSLTEPYREVNGLLG